MLRVDIDDAQSRLSELVRAVEECNETVILCRDGVEVAEIRQRLGRRLRDLTPDSRFKVTLPLGYDPSEPLTEDEWPEDAR